MKIMFEELFYYILSYQKNFTLGIVEFSFSSFTTIFKQFNTFFVKNSFKKFRFDYASHDHPSKDDSLRQNPYF